MSAEVKAEETKKEETQKTGFAKLMDIAEFRMVVYVVPVALVLIILAMVLTK